MIGQPTMQQGWQMRIKKLIVIRTGTYNDQYYRPFQTNLTPEVEQTLMYNLDPRQKFTPTLFSDVAVDFVRPASAPTGQVLVDGGFQVPRMRFYAEVEWRDSLGSTLTQILTGHTEHAIDLSYSKLLPPDLTFFVNNSFLFRHVTMPTVQGPVTQLHPVRGGQVFANPHYQGIMSNQPQESLLRPSDVLQYSALAGGITEHMQGDVTSFVCGTQITNDAKLSRRSNANPAAYMTQVLESFRKAYVTNPHEVEEDSLVNNAIHNSREEAVNADYFLSTISRLSGMNVIINAFTLGLLQQIQPDIMSVTHTMDINAADVKGSNLLIHQPHTAGASNTLHGSDPGTILATLLSHAVPGLLTDCALTSITIQAENTPTGIVVAIPQGTGFMGNMDLSTFFASFQSRFETEIYRGITLHGNRHLRLSMYCSLYGDTRIEMWLDGAYGFWVFPTFLDSANSPIRANNSNQLMDVSRGFKRAMDITQDAYGARFNHFNDMTHAQTGGSITGDSLGMIDTEGLI